jgi:hypothetical protein
MKRPVLIHGALLFAALLAAYFTWTRDQTGAEDEVQILSLRGNLERVVYKGDERTVEIERRKDDRGAYHWVHVETMEVPPPPPPKPAPPPAPTPTPAGAPTPAGTPPPPGKVEPKKLEPKKADVKAEPKKAEPKKAEPKKADKKAEPKKADKKAGDSLSRDPKADPEKKAPPKKAPPKKADVKAEPKAPPPGMPPGPRPGMPGMPPGPPPGMPGMGPRPFPSKLMPKSALQPPAPVVKVRKVVEFKGNKSVEELMKGLANLAAVRALGKVDADKLKAFGLVDTKKSLTLVAGSSPRVFLIGGNTYGNMDMYLQSKEDGRVYVVRPRLLQDFQYAEFRLMDRGLHSFENNEIERATISTPDAKKRVLVQQNRRDPAGSFWADEATPQQRKDLFRNWMTKVLGLRVLEYANLEKKPEGLKPILLVEYGAAGKPLGYLRLFRREGAPLPKPGAAPSTDEAGDYYAMTENSRALVKLGKPMGDEIARDIVNVLRE